MTRRVRILAAALAAAAALATAAPATTALAQTRFEPAAVVNDSVITRFDLEQRMRLLGAGSASPEALREEALDQLIDDRLKLEAARQAGMAPSREAVDAAVADYAAQRNVSVAELEQGLSRGGVSRAALEDALSAQVAWRDLIRRRYGARATPTDGEIAQEVALASSGQVRSWRLAEIAIPTGGRGGAGARTVAERLSAQLRAGGDFAEAARRNSASPSASQGGEIGWVTEAALPPPVVAAIEAAGPGGVTEPVDIPGGVMVLNVLERRTESLAGGPETVTLLAIEARGADAAARITAALAGATECDVAQAAAEASGLSAQLSPPTETVTLGPTVRETIAPLAVGQASAPIAAPNGATVAFVLCARDSGLSPEARERLAEQIRSRRLVGFANGYLQELRGAAVIEIR